MGFALTLLVGLLTLAYPFLIYYGLQYWNPRGLALVVAAAFLVRLLYNRKQGSKAGSMLPLAIAVLIICTLVLFKGQGDAFLYYPVVVNAVMFGTFAFTLKVGPPMIERFARLREKDLPEPAIAYCRKVTIVWCAFFVINGLVALGTVINGDMRVWTFYNGLVSYGLMGLLFAIEFIVRLFVKRKHETSERHHRPPS